MAVTGKISGDPVATTPTGAVMAGTQGGANVGVPASLFASAAQGNVPTRAVLKTLDTTQETAAYLTEAGREGAFVWRAGNYSAQIAADTLEGIYIKANAVASTAGAWVRVDIQESAYPSQFGGVGDGVTDDTAKIIAARTAAGSTGEIFLPSGKTYLVNPMPENPQGVVSRGPGKIVSNAASGGQWQHNTYADIPGGKYVYNAEYFYYPMTMMATSQADISVICGWRCWGDSTVAGGNGEWWKMHEVIGQHLKAIGLPLSSVFNHGVSGTDWRDWAETTNIDVQGGVDVVKYWINHNGQSLDEQFAAADAKLASRRAQTNGGIDKRAIILVTGNSTSDSVALRDEIWHEKVLPRLIALGRKYMCVVWDAYSLMQDSRRAGPPDGATTRWMDAPFAGVDQERHIHPIRGMNNMLYGRLMNEMLPQSVVNFWATNTFVNAGIAVSSPNVLAIPSQYDIGQRWYRATVANGWPFEAMIQTDRSVDTITVQRLVGWASGTTQVAERTADTVGDAWNPWVYLSSLETTSGLTIASPFVTAGGANSLRITQTGKWASPQGYITQASAIIANGATLFTAPASSWPKSQQSFPCFTSTGEVHQCRISTSGVVTIALATAACTSVEFGGGWIWGQ